jgi:hypothetical protein
VVCPQRPSVGTAGDQPSRVAGELTRYLEATGHSAVGLATSLLGRPARVRELDRRAIGAGRPPVRSARHLAVEDAQPPHRALVLVWEQARPDALPGELADRWSAGQPLLAAIPHPGAAWTATVREVETAAPATAGDAFAELPSAVLPSAVLPGAVLPSAVLVSIVWQVTAPPATGPAALVLEELPVAQDRAGQLLLPAQGSAVPPPSPAGSRERP